MCFARSQALSTWSAEKYFLGLYPEQSDFFEKTLIEWWRALKTPQRVRKLYQYTKLKTWKTNKTTTQQLLPQGSHTSASLSLVLLLCPSQLVYFYTVHKSTLLVTRPRKLLGLLCQIIFIGPEVCIEDRSSWRTETTNGILFFSLHRLRSFVTKKIIWPDSLLFCIEFHVLTKKKILLLQREQGPFSMLSLLKVLASSISRPCTQSRRQSLILLRVEIMSEQWYWKLWRAKKNNAQRPKQKVRN